MFNHILLAADDVDQARKAARVAGETARQMRSASLCIVVTYPSVPDFLSSSEINEETAARTGQAEALVESLLREVGAIPGEIQTEILEGTVAEAIITVSRTRESDLIVMGSKTTGFANRLAGWFRNNQIVNRARCPVMIVR